MRYSKILYTSQLMIVEEMLLATIGIDASIYMYNYNVIDYTIIINPLMCIQIVAWSTRSYLEFNGSASVQA